MKFNTLLLLTVSLLSATAGFSQQERTIAFYNIENLFDTIDNPNTNDNEYLPSAEKQWNSKRYFEKISHINTVVAEMNFPIILGLCEIENEAVVRDVIKGGQMKGAYGVIHTQSLDQRGIDNAIIYDSTLMTVVSSGIIRFDMPEPSSPSRDIVWAKFKLGEDEILAMVNHWPSRRGGQPVSEPKRMVAATAAKVFIDSVQIASPKMKIVFMGDLNDYPDNIAPRMISSILKPMITKKSGEFGGSYSYRGDWGVLDHIMVSKSFSKGKVCVKRKSGKINSYKYLKTEYKGNIVPFRTYGGKKYLNGYSDHFPVSVDVKIKK